MPESVWDYPRPPRVEPTARAVRIEYGGLLVAASERSLRVLETSHPPVYYLPRADVAAELAPNRRRTWCEFKGEASYWDVTVAGVTLSAAAWSYERPSPGYHELTGALAFYPARFDRCTVDGVAVTPQPSDFYGGWLTPDITGPVKGPPGTAGW